MTENKIADGLKFLLKLDMSSYSENMLLQLANDAINGSHDKRTFVERRGRDLLVNPTSVHLCSVIATGHAMTNSNLSTKDKLYMIMDRYVELAVRKKPKMSKDKALNNFCEEFAEKFPQAYGKGDMSKKMQQRAVVNHMLRNSGNQR